MIFDTIFVCVRVLLHEPHKTCIAVELNWGGLIVGRIIRELANKN